MADNIEADRFTEVECESDHDGARSQSATHSRTLVAEVSTPSNLAVIGSSLNIECCPALLVGNAFSKTVHIIAAPLSEDSDFHCVSSTSSKRSHAKKEAGSGYLPHYCMYADTYTDRQSASSQIEPAGAAVSTLIPVTYEDVHACTLTTIDEDVGGGNGCISIVTLCSVWRLIAIDTDDTNSTGDLFMNPIEESLIGQQSSSYELITH